MKGAVHASVTAEKTRAASQPYAFLPAVLQPSSAEPNDTKPSDGKRAEIPKWPPHVPCLSFPPQLPPEEADGSMDVDEPEAACPEEPLPLPFVPDNTGRMMYDFEIEEGTDRTPAGRMVPVHWTAVVGGKPPDAADTPGSPQPATPIYLISNFNRNWDFTKKRRQKLVGDGRRPLHFPCSLLQDSGAGGLSSLSPD